MKLTLLNSKTFLSIALIMLGLSSTSVAFSTDTDAQNKNQHFDYFKTLSSFCGDHFEGLMTYPDNDQSEFAGKLLVATFETCSESQIRVPFRVGDDTSRTWVFTKLPNSIQLKHEHRYADGSVHEVSNYGGQTVSLGTTEAQAFPADEYTKALIPEAATNVWNVSFDLEKKELTYHLERHNEPRFTAVLSRVISGERNVD